MVVCKGFCVEFRAGWPFGTNPYDSGLKRCVRCEIFLKYEGNRCPCCNQLLRLKPVLSNSKYNLKIIEGKRI